MSIHNGPHLRADGTHNHKKQFPVTAVVESLARRAVADLDARQAIFATTYVETFDLAESAKRSGYEDSYASQLLKHPMVARAIQLLQTDKLHKIESALPVNAEMVINGIVRNIHALEAKGKNEATFKGYELLGKHLSMWQENINVTDNTAELSPTDRAARITALMALAKARHAKDEDRTIDVTPPPQGDTPSPIRDTPSPIRGTSPIIPEDDLPLDEDEEPLI